MGGVMQAKIERGIICPNCGGPVMYYHSSHSSHKYGEGITRIVCKEKCQGWKIIKEIVRKG